MMDLPEWRKKMQEYYSGGLKPEEKEELLQFLDGLSPAELEAIFPRDEWKDILPVSLSGAELDAAWKGFGERAGIGAGIGYETAGGASSAAAAASSTAAAASSADASAAAAEEEEGKAGVFHIQGRRKARFYWRAASIIAAVTISGILTVKYIRHTSRTKTELADTPGYRSVRVPDGSRSRLVLPDGSVLTLNGGTVLSVPGQFAGDAREIYLRGGEAYFEVAKDAARPFIVHSPNLDIRVLGTSFSLRDYLDEKDAETSVSSGRISVTHTAANGEPQYLSAGNKLVLHKDRSHFERMDTDTAAVAAWIRGELIFHGATLEQVLQVLKHRFAVSFKVDRAGSKEEKFTATFRNNSLETILQQLHLMSGIQYSIQGARVLIQ